MAAAAAAAMGTWAVIKLIIALLPEIIEFVKRSAVLVNGAVDTVQTRAKAKEMLERRTLAEETGDTSAVEAIFRNGGLTPPPARK